MAVAIAFRSATGKGSALLEAIAFGLGGVIVFAALDGAWLWGNAKAYGNPIFPYMNNVFRSDLVEPTPWTHLRFMPKTALMAAFYPAYWAFRSSSDVSELAMRDPRILLGPARARLLSSPVSPPVGSVTAQGRRWAGSSSSPSHWPLRSLSPQRAVGRRSGPSIAISPFRRVLSGVLALAALPTAFGARSKPLLVSGLFALIVVWSARTTQYPWWDRAQRGPQAVFVQAPPLEPDAMVLFLDPQPYAYLVASMPNVARAIGVNNNLVHPGASGRLWSIIEEAVRDHHGPLWGVEDPHDHPGVADASLSSLGLVRRLESARRWSPTWSRRGE